MNGCCRAADEAGWSDPVDVRGVDQVDPALKRGGDGIFGVLFGNVSPLATTDAPGPETYIGDLPTGFPNRRYFISCSAFSDFVESRARAGARPWRIYSYAHNTSVNMRHYFFERADLIAKLPDRGVTVCIIDHDMDLIAELCHRLVVLDFGQKISEGSPDAVRSDPKVLEIYLGTDL